MQAHELRDEVRRQLNEAVAVLCPGGSGDVRDVEARLYWVIWYVRQEAPAVEAEERRQQRLARVREHLRRSEETAAPRA